MLELTTLVAVQVYSPVLPAVKRSRVSSVWVSLNSNKSIDRSSPLNAHVMLGAGRPSNKQVRVTEVLTGTSTGNGVPSWIDGASVRIKVCITGVEERERGRGGGREEREAHSRQ